MKKTLFIALLFAACKPANHDGTYVNHTNGSYAVTDDTLIIADSLVINRVGYQKIRNGRLLPKNLKVEHWSLRSPDAPLMRISDQQITIGQTIYNKLP